MPNIPRLQHSIIPAGMYGRLHPSGVAPKPGPLDPDIYFLEFERYGKRQKNISSTQKAR